MRRLVLAEEREREREREKPKHISALAVGGASKPKPITAS